MPDPTDSFRLLCAKPNDPVLVEVTIDNGVNGDLLLERFSPDGPAENFPNKHRIVFNLPPPSVDYNIALLHTLILGAGGGSASMIYVQGGTIKNDPNDGPYIAGGDRLDAVRYDRVKDQYVPAGQKEDKTLAVAIGPGVTKLQKYTTFNK